MATGSVLVMVDGQLGAQNSSDNIVLTGNLDVLSSPIQSSSGDIILRPTANGNVKAGYSPSSNNATLSFIGGGQSNNTFNCVGGFIGSGKDNRASGDYASVASGNNCDALVAGASVWGGQDHIANGDNATILGGLTSKASGNRTLSGGESQNAAPPNSVAVGGKSLSIATGNYSGAFGGLSNTITSLGTALIGGKSNSQNTSTSPLNVVVGGTAHAIASSYCCFLGGYLSKASGTSRLGGCVAGGQQTDASGDYGGSLSGKSHTVSGYNTCALGGSSLNMSSANAVMMGRNHYLNDTDRTVMVMGQGAIKTNGDVACFNCITTNSSNTNNTVSMTLGRQGVNTTWVGEVDVTGFKSDTGDKAAWYRVRFTTRRGPVTGNNYTVFVAASGITNPLVETMHEDTAAWTCTMNITSNVPTIYVTGATGAASKYKWVAHWYITKVGVM